MDNWNHRLVALESMLLGERNLGQQTLEIVIFGYSTPEDAEGALRRQMGNFINLRLKPGTICFFFLDKNGIPSVAAVVHF